MGGSGFGAGATGSTGGTISTTGSAGGVTFFLAGIFSPNHGIDYNEANL
jgi:hypothetical protein